MSWRLWYRESSLKESERIAASTCPIPIQQSRKETDKHLSSTSFKRIISSLNENKIIQPTKSSKNKTLIQFEKPKASKTNANKAHSYIESTHKFQPTIKACHSAMEVSLSAVGVSQHVIKVTQSGNEPSIITKQLTINSNQSINTPKTQKSVSLVKPQEERSKFFIKEDDEQEWSSDEEDRDATPKNSVDFVEQNVKINGADYDETAFLSEFRKRSPPPISIIAKRSVLSNMLQVESTTRLAIPNRVTQNQQHDQLSTSLKRCLRRERQGLGYDLPLKSDIDSRYDGLEHTFYGYW